MIYRIPITLSTFSRKTGWTEVNNLLGLRDYNEERVRDSFGDDAAASFLEAQQEGRLVDYEKEIFGEKGLISITNFSMSGGSEKTRFYTGITHNDEEGIVKGTGYKKTSLRLNLDHRPTDFIKLGLSSSYAHSSANRGFQNPYNFRSHQMVD